MGENGIVWCALNTNGFFLHEKGGSLATFDSRETAREMVRAGAELR